MRTYNNLGLLLLLTTAFTLSRPVSGGAADNYALIVGGVGGQPRYTQKYLDQTGLMYSVLVDSFSYGSDKVTYLFEKPELDSLRIDGISTSTNVRNAFGQLKAQMKAQDQLFVLLLGHGSFDGTWGKFNLVGPDLRDVDYADLLADLPTRKVIFVNTASSSGAFIDKLTAKQRVIISATKSGRQIFETSFADFFLDAFVNPQADLDKNKRVSIAEAFNFARGSQDRWFEEKRIIRAEHPLLDDNGDGEGSQKTESSGDGLWAKRVYIEPKSPKASVAELRLKSGTATATDSLAITKAAISDEIDDLKARKEQVEAKDYSAQMETLLIKLAKLNREIKLREAGREQLPLP